MISLPEAGPNGIQIDLKPIGPNEAPGGLAGAAPHTSNDTDYEAPYWKTESALRVDVDKFNKRAEAIADLRQIEELVAETRILIWRWDDTVAQRLQIEAMRDNGFHVAKQLAEQEQRAWQQEARAAEQGIRDADEAGDRQTAQTLARLRDDADRARAERWKGEVGVGLAFLRASYQVYAAYEADATRSRSESVAGEMKQPVERIRKGGAKGAAMPMRAQRRPVDLNNPRERITMHSKIEQMIRDIPSVSKYKGLLPTHETVEELYFQQIITVLDLLDRTAPDHRGVPQPANYKKQAEEVAGDISDHDFIQATLKLIMSTPVVDDSLDSPYNRMQLRREVNEKLQAYALRRVEEYALKKAPRR